MQFPHPLLVCDIGGTNVRVARVSEPGAEPQILQHLKTADHPDLAEAVRSLRGWEPRTDRSMLVCAAGPSRGRTITLTNAGWTINGPEVAERLGLQQGLLLNDFEAQALAITAVPADWRHPIGSVPEITGETRIVLGPGTGLGMAGISRVEGRWLPFPSEAGHMDFGPFGKEEEALWPHLPRSHGRVSAETVCSGPGLERLHQAYRALRGLSDKASDGVAIVAGALKDKTGAEADTVRLFWRLVARFAGDMALGSLARGGVTLSGGILPRIIELLDEQTFRATFEAKAPMDGLLRQIATSVLVAPDAVLAGMAAVAANPNAYILEYASRAWVQAA